MTQTKVVPEERCPACEHYEQIAKNTEARRAVAFELFHIYYKQTRAQDKGIKRLHRKIVRLEKKPCYAEIAGAVARGWCSPANQHKEMDTRLAMAITVEVVKLLAASPAPQERRVGQGRTNLGWASNSDITLKRIKHAQDRRVVAPIAAGQDGLDNNPKTLVEPVPAVPNYSSVPMGPVGATYPAPSTLESALLKLPRYLRPCSDGGMNDYEGTKEAFVSEFAYSELRLIAIDLADELRDVKIFKDASVPRLAVLGTRIDELEKQVEYERQWKEQYYTQSMRQTDKLSEVRRENAALCHDIVRHVQIAADQANEIAELNRIVTMLNDELKRRLG